MVIGIISIQSARRDLNLPQDVNVAVMTYASEIYAWYAGTVTSDVYFCPERQGTYFGSFYLKDWPAMGNPDYTINEQLTATAGENFLSILSVSQADQLKGIIDLQRSCPAGDLLKREKRFQLNCVNFCHPKQLILQMYLVLSERYGELDGEISLYLCNDFFTGL